MNKKLINLFMILLIVIVGCSNKSEIRIEDIEKIQLDLVEIQNMDDGTEYHIKLLNESDYVIKQNIVHFEYPIKLDNGIKENKYKIEATNNRLNIQPDEEVMLYVFAPFEGMSENQTLALDDPSVMLKGYLEEVNEEYMFSIGRILTLNHSE
ncbi:hypothetical protein [Alkalihalophilus marmarensis]|uniref:Lipoprotein n=1 Tax=Alkalihalophilus marmarensis DSM 21297 TaxID=1188261 RepID=U6SLL0_9BACI|nr:hypothetical protein [Alkalihalophilus marmarensis]ERN51511.1 hypothetical protein A33I_20285 [Alkalihalophilus marmarensis DSM 21297]